MPTVASLVAEVRADIKDFQSKMKTVEGTLDRIEGKAVSTGTNSGNAMERFFNRATRAGENLSKVGQTLTIGLTLPLIGVGKAAIDSATRMDAARKSLTAVMGSAEAAEAEIDKLYQTAKKPGLGFAQAIRGSAALQSVRFEADSARDIMEKLGNAIARAGGNADMLENVVRQITRIKGAGKLQGDELNIITEQIPEFRQILGDMFGTTDPQAINKQFKVDEIIDKLVEGLGKLNAVEPGFAERLQDLADRGTLMLEKFGVPLLDLILRISDKAMPILEKVFEAFGNLPPEAQEWIIIFLGIAAAIGPVLVALGAVATAIGTIGPIIAPAIPYILAIGAAIVALAAIWSKNIGGIQEKTMEVFSGLQEAFNFMKTHVEDLFNKVWPQIVETLEPILQDLQPLIEDIQKYMQESFGETVAWFQENWPLIQQTVETVMGWIQVYIENNLKIIRQFWDTYGEGIVATARSVFNVIAEVAKGIGDWVRGAIKTVMQLINGDWSGAMKTWVETGEKVREHLGNAFRSIWDTIKNIMGLIVTHIKQEAQRMLGIAITIGTNIIQGIVNGIKARVNLAKKVITDTATTIINTAKSVLKIKSPSQEFVKIGEQTIDGFTLGIGSMIPALQESAREAVLSFMGEWAEETDRQISAIEGAYNSLMLGIERKMATTPEEIASIDILGKKYSELEDYVKSLIDQYVGLQKVQEFMDFKMPESMDLGPSGPSSAVMGAGASIGDKMQEMLDERTKAEDNLNKLLADRYAESEKAMNKALGQWSNLDELMETLGLNYDDLNASQREWIAKILQSKDALDNLKMYQQQVATQQQEILNAAWDLSYVIRDAFEDAYEKGFNKFFTNVLAGFKRLLFRMALEYLQSQLVKYLQNTLFGGGLLNSIFGISQVGGQVGPDFIGPMPARASGGKVRAGLTYRVGEHGMEMFQPQVDGEIYSNAKSRAYLHDADSGDSGSSSRSGSGGDTYVFSPTYNIKTDNVKEFQKSQRQTIMDADREFRRVTG